MNADQVLKEIARLKSELDKLQRKQDSVAIGTTRAMLAELQTRLTRLERSVD